MVPYYLLDICAKCGRIRFIYDRRALVCYNCYHRLSPYHIKIKDRKEKKDEKVGNCDDTGKLFDRSV